MEYWVLKIGGMGKRCFRFPMKVLTNKCMTCYHSIIPGCWSVCLSHFFYGYDVYLFPVRKYLFLEEGRYCISEKFLFPGKGWFVFVQK
jgi:hypothetical protein